MKVCALQNRQAYFNRQIFQATEHASSQLIRYSVVGGVAFAVDFTLLVLLTDVVYLNYLWSAAIAFLAGLVVNYQLSISWVFSHRTLENRQFEFLVFTAIGLIGLVLTELILYGGTEYLNIDYRWVKIVAVAVVLFWNFGLRKLLLFRNKRLV